MNQNRVWRPIWGVRRLVPCPPGSRPPPCSNNPVLHKQFKGGCMDGGCTEKGAITAVAYNVPFTDKILQPKQCNVDLVSGLRCGMSGLPTAPSEARLCPARLAHHHIRECADPPLRLECQRAIGHLPDMCRLPGHRKREPWPENMTPLLAKYLYHFYLSTTCEYTKIKSKTRKKNNLNEWWLT